MWLIFALLSAVCFGLRGILYHWTSQQGLQRNLMLCGTFFMGALISLVCSLVLRQDWTASAMVGIQMGLFSFAANASLFQGFKVGKASVVAVLTALPAVLVVISAYFIWGERLNLTQLIAFMIIICGVLLVRYSNDISLQNLQGAQWGLIALVLFAGNDLTGKWSTLLEAPMFPTLTYMFFTGTLCFGVGSLMDYRKQAAKQVTVSGQKAAWSAQNTFLLGMGIGITNTVGMIMILTAFDYGKAGLVSAVAALNVVIILLYTRFVVQDRFTRLETAGLVTAFAGILVMRLFGS
ncbi:DMT family transporter [Paenibacillus sp. P96]|uniref:DMT family transporter n=1 Tax=Paenibacillus zeirhizosphaerae TaxID=2987519 RepID=A0ABT9FVI6_9BACL|nr:DMT family transporter [Paenibacillus sp. P96]MDP4098752.1 DMT family transporter [Paenibacillus sp. P96]